MIAVGAVGIIGTITYAFFANPAYHPKPSALAESGLAGKGQNFDVQYTNDGYNPNYLEVPVGSQITFHNTSAYPMWTASDPHPTHTDYPLFDAKKDYAPGENFVFIFNDTGTFGYHNHEKSNHRGIIKVINPDNPQPNIDKTKEELKATRDKYLAMLQPGDPESVFKVIDAIEKNPSLVNDCHDMAHDLGHHAYELYGFSAAMTFNDPHRQGHTSVDDICAGGYMHGILEEVFLHQPQLKSNASELCSSIPENNRGSCFHGVGHGLMFVNKRDVPTSLSDCRNLDKNTSTWRCFEGVWMEMFWGNTNHAGADSLGWTPEKPLEPCVNAKNDEKPACFLYAHLGYLRNHHYDFTGAMNLCTKNNLNLSDETFCVRGIGMTMMKHFTSNSLEKTEQLVSGYGFWEKYAYYQGVISYARLSSVSESKLQTFCSELQNDWQICQQVLSGSNK